jgi:hypothetical protein
MDLARAGARTTEIVSLSTLIRKLWSSAVTVTTLRVDHADLDALGGDHDGAALGYPPLPAPAAGAGRLAAWRAPRSHRPPASRPRTDTAAPLQAGRNAGRNEAPAASWLPGAAASRHSADTPRGATGPTRRHWSVPAAGAKCGNSRASSATRRSRHVRALPVHACAHFHAARPATTMPNSDVCRRAKCPRSRRYGAQLGPIAWPGSRGRLTGFRKSGSDLGFGVLLSTLARPASDDAIPVT